MSTYVLPWISLEGMTILQKANRVCQELARFATPCEEGTRTIYDLSTELQTCVFTNVVDILLTRQELYTKKDVLFSNIEEFYIDSRYSPTAFPEFGFRLISGKKEFW